MAFLRFIFLYALLLTSSLASEEACDLSAAPYRSDISSLSEASVNAADRAVRIDCDGLYEMTCDAGEYPDGTGVTLSQQNFEARKKVIVRDTATAAEPLFRASLSDPQNAELVRKIVAAAPSARAQCPNVIPPLTPECLATVAQAAVQVFSTSRGSGISNTGTSLDPRQTLIEDQTFQSIARTAIRSMRASLTGELERPVRETFTGIKERLLQKIEREVSDPAMKERMLGRIRSIVFGGSDDPNSPTDSIDSLLDRGGHFDPHSTPPRFIYRLGSLLESTSRFQMAYIIGHELSHSIDPCMISEGAAPILSYRRDSIQGLEHQHPYGNVLSCLSSPQSANAPVTIVPDHSGKTPDVFDSYCGISNRLSESFADWMSMELVPGYLRTTYPSLSPGQYTKGYSNIWRGQCQNNTPELIGRYPDQSLRVNAIIGGNASARSQMKCRPSSAVRYCSLNSR